jgi:hypothetical protein
VNARIQIADELVMMVRQRASGSLEISGNPGGSIFMSGGYLTFAESPGVPDLGTRLVCARRLSAEEWRRMTENSQEHAGICAALVSQGIITINELRALLRSITVDTLVALAASQSAQPQSAQPQSAEPLAASIRFWPRRSHWVGSLLRLDVSSVWADAEQKAERLTVLGITAGDRPRWCDLKRPWAVVRKGQWTVAGQSDGMVTVKDLAWRNGFPLCDVMEWVGELVQTGLCTLAPATPSQEPPTPRPVSDDGHPPSEPVNDEVPAAEPADDAHLPLPQRKPGATLATRATRPARIGLPATIRHHPVIQPPPQPPPPDLWRRILKGLKRTD